MCAYLYPALVFVFFIQPNLKDISTFSYEEYEIEDDVTKLCSPNKLTLNTAARHTYVLAVMEFILRHLSTPKSPVTMRVRNCHFIARIIAYHGRYTDLLRQLLIFYVHFFIICVIVQDIYYQRKDVFDSQQKVDRAVLGTYRLVISLCHSRVVIFQTSDYIFFFCGVLCYYSPQTLQQCSEFKEAI